MLPAFYINSFKPWAPPSRKPFPPRKILPPPKHYLPARPPAKVCVPTKTPSHTMVSPNNSAPYILEPDIITRFPPAVNSIINSKAIYLYPDPLPHPGVSYPNSALGNHHVSGYFIGPKQKARHSDKGACKRSRAPSRGNSFTALYSYFVLLPTNKRLQFLSWLFEGALPCCMSDFSPTVRKAGDVRKTSCLSLSSSYGIKQDQHNCGEGKGSLRKSKKWSSKEANLLLELRGDGKRPWTEVTRLFSEQYPGRSPGAIQVYWSTTLSKKPE
ncbi:hypothetical protein BDV06DRAFT_234787 [Aspergillus oleicola]